jgi:sulfotransferase family protein
MLPTFVIIGAQKAATTSLHYYLSAHPDVYIPPFKETNFFAAEGNWQLGLDWYRSQFAPAGQAGAVQVGDVSPGYTMFPYFAGVPERMASVLPDARLIYVLREPVARTHSSYLQGLTDGLEHRPLEEALFDGRYLLVSCYALQLEQYLEHFDRAQLLVLRAEDLEARPSETFGRLLDFLGLDPGAAAGDFKERYNVSTGKRVPKRRTRAAEGALRRLGSETLASRLREAGRGAPAWSRPLRPEELELDPDLRERLRRCFIADAQRLRAIVGPDLDLWGLA